MSVVTGEICDTPELNALLGESSLLLIFLDGLRCRPYESVLMVLLVCN